MWDAINRRMGELMPLAISVITEIFDSYDEMPFGLDLGQFTDYATTTSPADWRDWSAPDHRDCKRSCVRHRRKAEILVVAARRRCCAVRRLASRADREFPKWIGNLPDHGALPETPSGIGQCHQFSGRVH